MFKACLITVNAWYHDEKTLWIVLFWLHPLLLLRYLPDGIFDSFVSTTWKLVVMVK